MERLTEIATELVEQTWQVPVRDCQILRDGRNKILLINQNEPTPLLLKGEKVSQGMMEKICDFSQHLAEILPVTEYLSTLENSHTVTHGEYVFTLERQLSGREVSQMNPRIMQELGRQLARLHKFSLTQELRLGRGSIWGMFNEFDDNGDDFAAFAEALPAEKIQLISQLFHAYRKKLAAVWQELPTSAIQGDFCYYNLLFDAADHLVGVFDFNGAGDEVLLNECLAVGIYHAWHVPHESGTSAAELFKLYLNSYRHERPWTVAEQAVAPELFGLLRAFRYDRVAHGIADRSDHANFIAETERILKELPDFR